MPQRTPRPNNVILSEAQLREFNELMLGASSDRLVIDEATVPTIAPERQMLTPGTVTRGSSRTSLRPPEVDRGELRGPNGPYRTWFLPEQANAFIGVDHGFADVPDHVPEPPRATEPEFYAPKPLDVKVLPVKMTKRELRYLSTQMKEACQTMQLGDLLTLTFPSGISIEVRITAND